MDINLHAVIDNTRFISAEATAKDVIQLAYDEDEKSKEYFTAEIKTIVENNDYLVIVAIRNLHKLSISNNTVKKFPGWSTEILIKYNIIVDISQSML